MRLFPCSFPSYGFTPFPGRLDAMDRLLLLLGNLALTLISAYGLKKSFKMNKQEHPKNLSGHVHHLTSVCGIGLSTAALINSVVRFSRMFSPYPYI
ncbi:MAG: hypothetical protein ACOYK9_05890 [Chlamydiia bacterium]